MLEDPFADPEHRWRAWVDDERLGGRLDAAGATPEMALDRAQRRWRLAWLGVEWTSIATPDDAQDPERGQIALNGRRYALWRHVGPAERCVCWVMLNPSTANHQADDATLRRITRYTLDWGFGWLTVGNLWPLRATDPAELRAWLAAREHHEEHPIINNEQRVIVMATQAELVVAAWGTPGRWEGQGRRMRKLLEGEGIELHALAVTKEGEPSHPLRLASDLQPRPLRALMMPAAAA